MTMHVAPEDRGYMEVDAVDLATRTDDVIHALTNGDGYVIIRQFLPPDIVNSARSIITTANLPRRILRRLLFRHAPHPPVRTFDLFTRSPRIFGHFLDDAALGDIIECICGEGAKCGSFHSHTIFPSYSSTADEDDDAIYLAQGLHIDYPYGSHAPFLTKSNPPIGAPKTVQVLWMLDDFTLSNGSTIVIPGSQKLWHAPNENNHNDVSMQHAIDTHVHITGQRGDVMMYTGQLWHGVPKNHTTQCRTAVLGQFLPYYMIPMEDHANVISHAVLHALPVRAATLLSEQLIPRNLWTWYICPPSSLLRRIVTVCFSSSGLCAAILAAMSSSAIVLCTARAHYDNGGSPSSSTTLSSQLLVAIGCATSGYVWGVFATLSKRDLGR